MYCKKDFFFGFYYKNDFLKEIERFCNHFSQKLKGFLKSRVILEFWGVCMRLFKNYRLLGGRFSLF
ncbi:hypothetical protein [Helicobacter pylori]|uniref:hypothetical protein n=1 Tax=Helicobacter pylori TaxID=210 RepID=UPI0030FE71DA